jgi:hypothetical protein
MPDDREDRRQKDLRDLEFYRQRVRPSATDLWRTLERPRSNSAAILAKRAPGGRSDGRLGLTTPSSIAEVQEDSRLRGWPSFEPGSPASDRTEADAIWPLVCAVIVLVVTALTDSIGRVATALPFWIFEIRRFWRPLATLALAKGLPIWFSAAAPFLTTR